VAAKKTSMLEEVAATFLQDHTAEDPAERARVEAAGGIVQWRVDTWRVGHAAIQVIRGGYLLLNLLRLLQLMTIPPESHYRRTTGLDSNC
jgi:hypothetical protein